MSSCGKRRQQKTPFGGWPQEKMVNPSVSVEALSFSSAQIEEKSCELRGGLMAKVVKRSNVMMALDRVEKNHGAPGVDGMKTGELRQYLNANNMENWKRIRSELLNGIYKPLPLRRKSIPKPGGGERHLGIPTVIDRLIQQALMQILTPIFDPGFSKSSFGFRPRRKAHQAIKQAQVFINKGYRIVVDMDLEKFFDRVNHDILMSRISRKVGDKSVLKLIRSFLESGVMVNGCCITSDEGTPQGGPISPLLANIMLDDLDKELEKRGHSFCRYADDCNIYVKSMRAGRRVMDSVRRMLKHRLKLKVNEEKSAVARPWERKFLGFSFTWQENARIRIAPKAIKQFKDKIRELTRRRWSISMTERIKKVNVYIQGWMGYFHLTDTLSVLEGLDGWMRRRLRMCVLKQWKFPSTRRKNLCALGIGVGDARAISSSSKGCWKLAKTPQINKALSNDYWSCLGLKTLVGTYQKLRLTL